jgi:hypothetical protein
MVFRLPEAALRALVSERRGVGLPTPNTDGGMNELRILERSSINKPGRISARIVVVIG